jgi:hypothetical protein
MILILKGSLALLSLLLSHEFGPRSAGDGTSDADLAADVLPSPDNPTGGKTAGATGWVIPPPRP